MEHSHVLNWTELSWGKHSYHTQNLEWEHNYLSNSNRCKMGAIAEDLVQERNVIGGQN